MRHDDDIDESLDQWSADFFDNHDLYKENDEEDIVESAKLHKEPKPKDLDEEDEDVVVNKIADFEEVDTGSIEDFNRERVSEVTGKLVTNYVDNDTFCNAVIAWNVACKEAREAGKKIPLMPDVIGHQILKMTEGLARRYNFRNYTYIDEMREDAIYMAIRAVKNFDPTKSKNAFGYFNFVAWRAMTTRIKEEKSENEIKMSLLKDPMYLGYTSESSQDDVDKNRLISIYDQ